MRLVTGHLNKNLLISFITYCNPRKICFQNPALWCQRAKQIGLCVQNGSVKREKLVPIAYQWNWKISWRN